jgi:hypothetical protein
LPFHPEPLGFRVECLDGTDGNDVQCQRATRGGRGGGSLWFASFRPVASIVWSRAATARWETVASAAATAQRKIIEDES